MRGYFMSSVSVFQMVTDKVEVVWKMEKMYYKCNLDKAERRFLRYQTKRDIQYVPVQFYILCFILAAISDRVNF